MTVYIGVEVTRSLKKASGSISLLFQKYLCELLLPQMCGGKSFACNSKHIQGAGGGDQLGPWVGCKHWGWSNMGSGEGNRMGELLVFGGAPSYDAVPIDPGTLLQVTMEVKGEGGIGKENTVRREQHTTLNSAGLWGSLMA